MDAIEVKEEPIVDVNGYPDSKDDPLYIETIKANRPLGQNDPVDLEKLAKLLTRFTTIKTEPYSSDIVRDYSNDNTSKPEDPFQVLDIKVINTVPKKENLEACTALIDDQEQDKLLEFINTAPKKENIENFTALTDDEEQAVLTEAQCLDRENGPRTRKHTASNDVTPLKVPEYDWEKHNKYGLKFLTINLGPRQPHSEHSPSNINLKIYSCRKCTTKFTNLSAYKGHVASCGTKPNKSDWFKNTENLYHCKICCYKFESMTNLQNHMAKHPSKNFSCNSCSAEFYAIDVLRVHYNKQHRDKSVSKIYSCNVCSYSTPYIYHLKEHLIMHIPDRNLYCTRCRRNCEDEIAYSEHWATLHSNVKKRKPLNLDNNPVPCKKRKNETSPNVDDNISRKDDVPKCGEQGESAKYDMVPRITNNYLESLRSSYESEEIKLKGRIYYCNTCIYKFCQLEHLMEHKKQHLSTQTPFKCYECKYESFSLANMDKHCRQMYHSTTGKCNECHIKSQSWKSLRRHTINHIYDGLFCRQCFLNFETYELCKDHMLTVHNVASKENLYSCNQCSYAHPKEVAYRKHVMHNHSSKRRHTKVSKIPVKTKLRTIKEVKIAGHSRRRTIPSQSDGYINVDLIKNQTNNRLSEKKVFSRKTHHDLASHMPSHYQYNCAKCDFTSNEFGSFIKHDSQKHSENTFKCNICFKKLKSLKDYLNHINFHDGIVVYECPYCKYSSCKEVDISKHATAHECYTCPMCVYKTCNIKLFENHTEKNHQPGRTFSCAVCPHSVYVKHNLNLHCLKYHPQQFCKMKLSVPKSLSYDHQDQVGCKLCSFTCLKSKSYDLKRHIIRHFTNGSRSKLKSKRLGLKRLGSKKKNPPTDRFGTQHNMIGEMKDNTFLKEIQFSDLSVEKSVPLKHTIGSHGSKFSNRLESVCTDRTIPRENTKVAAVKTSSKYSCSKCDMISKHRKSVQNHIRIVHKIIGGGVRNNMIRRIERGSLKVKETNQSMYTLVTKTQRDDFSLVVNPKLNENSVTRVSFNNIQEKVEKPNDSVKNVDLISNKTMNESIILKEIPSPTKQDILNPSQNDFIAVTNTTPNYGVYFCCSQCNLKTKDINTFTAHLRHHKIGGAGKKKEVLKVYNDQQKNRISRSNVTNFKIVAGKKKEVLKVYNDQQKNQKSRSNKTKLISTDIYDVQSRNGEESTTHVVEEKNLTPSCSLSGSGSLKFSCELCPFKNELRRSLFDHLSNYHHVKKEMITHLIRQQTND